MKDETVKLTNKEKLTSYNYQAKAISFIGLTRISAETHLLALRTYDFTMYRCARALICVKFCYHKEGNDMKNKTAQAKS